ncbi:hypothetical protein [Qipengyuania gelatinilytica]|uniref:Uncharacterized protein n=1 Tax=Qipengyuania gelatinilytica TaxID=2867231 RepID=A0ABX9A9B7_9SPHN|nr:hypothetical protein [Qipengyuania gelatinilytica]QZD96382.1 hypothetical protein K3136_06810 [Qipengyuania gelatinilytica]
MMTALAAPAANRIRAIYWTVAALVLLLPAIAMQVTADVNWGPGDFAMMGGLLALVGIGIEMALRATLGTRARMIAIGAILALFLLVWAELAVGLFD